MKSVDAYATKNITIIKDVINNSLVHMLSAHDLKEKK